MFKQDQKISLAKNLPLEFHYQSNFVDINGIKLHFVTEGNTDAPTILFLHGVPTWSYTFRRIFPACIKNGYRIIAPDLPGFGKSDKPADSAFYSLNNLVEYIAEFIEQLELKHFFLFAHDWGAIIGMILAAKYPDRFAGIIVCNGYLPVINTKTPFLFRTWKLFCKYSPVLPPGRIVDFASNRKLSQAEKKGYDFPFFARGEKTAIRILPQLIPINKNDIGANLIQGCWNKLENWEKPFLTVFSDNDAITKGGEKIIQTRIPGAKNQAHRILKGKHFLQEDAPEELSQIINDFVKSNL